MSAILASVQLEADRPPRPAVQQPAAGAPPLPAQMNRGLPSAAAFCRASQMVGYQATSIQRDSPGWGFIMPCSFSNSATDSDGASFPWAGVRLAVLSTAKRIAHFENVVGLMRCSLITPPTRTSTTLSERS